MPFKHGDRVMALVDFFPPDQVHGMEYWPMAGEEGTVQGFEGPGPDGSPLYAIRFDDDAEASEDGATWTYALEELEIVS